MRKELAPLIAELDAVIAAQLQTMRRESALPALSPKPRVRGKKPHDPKFDVRVALYYVTGVDLTAGYHTYGLAWDPGQSLTWYLDGKEIAEITSAEAPFISAATPPSMMS